MCTMLLWTNQRGELLWHCTEVTKPMNLINITSFIQNNLLSRKVAGLEEENVSIILYKLSLLSCLITLTKEAIFTVKLWQLCRRVSSIGITPG